MRSSVGMLASYLKTGWRALLRQKIHLALNLIGLSVGLAAAVLILLFVQFERGYDQMHPEAENTYRVEQYFNPVEQRFPVSSPSIVDEFYAWDERIEGTRLFQGALTLRPERESLPMQLDYLAIEPNFSDFFTLEVIAGSLQSMLSAPENIALSRDQSKRLFGEVNSIGQVLMSSERTFTVVAVYELPERSHLNADSLRLASESMLDAPLMTNSAYSYVRIPVDLDREALRTSISQALNDKAYESQNTAQIMLRPLTDIHLHSQLSYELKTNGSWATLFTASLLAALLLGIAAINFINMSIARAALRAKEVGVRKTLGGSRWQLFTQFMLESLMVAFIASFGAAVLIELGFSAFTNLVNRPIELNYFGSFGVLLVLCGTIIGLLAGIYPALFISAFSAKRVLSGDLQRGVTAVWVRKGLLVLQGAITVALLVGSAILQQQLNTLLNHDVGYQTEARLVVHEVDNRQVLWSENQSLLDDLATIDFVNSVSALDVDLTDTLSQVVRLRLPGQTQSEQLPPVASFGGAFKVVETAGFTLVAGRDFDPVMQADWFQMDDERGSASAIITESLARRAGYSNAEDVIGKTWLIDDVMPTDLNIVGVVRDFQVGAAVRHREPVIIIAGRSPMPYSNIIMSVDPLMASQARNDVEAMMQERLNRMDIRTSWLSADFTAMYENQQRQRTIIMLFAGLAILLTCVGLFGLAAFSADQRAKEVAIRKVLGAKRLQIVTTLAKEYMILMGVSVLIAVPSTYFFVEWWLSSFSVRTSQSAALYIAAAALTFVICWLTVAGISMRVASRKPGLVLRQY